MSEEIKYGTEFLDQLKDKVHDQYDEIERLNNDIKELLKENENKEKVIIAQDNIIKEVREYINNSGGVELVNNYSFPEKPIIDKLAKTELLEILDKVSNNETNTL